MSWPVFITVDDETIAVDEISGYWERRYYEDTPDGKRNMVARSCHIRMKHRVTSDDSFDVMFDGGIEEFDALIADAIAVTAKLVARAEAEAIDEHREAVRARQTYFTNPAPVIPELRLQP